MTMTRISSDQAEAIKKDLTTLGMRGSELLAIPPFSQNADSHEFIREIFLAFLRSMFRSMPGDYTWDSDETRSKVYIGYADPRGTAAKGKTPAITVELTPYTFGNSSINNFLGGTADGTRYYTELRNGAVVVRCRSSTKLEADSLAHVILGGIKYMRQDIERLYGLHYVDAYTANPSSGELQSTSTEGEMFVSNVVANVHYQESWKKPPVRTFRGKVVFVADPEGEILD